MPSRITLGLARTALPDVCFPAGAKNSAATAAAPINQATDLLITYGKWRGTLQQVAFTVYDDQITLPRNLFTVLGAAIRGTGDRSRLSWQQNVNNQWFQFITGGPGLNTNPPYDTFGFQDRGDGFMLIRDLPSVGRLKVVTTTTGESGTFSIRGYSNSAKVYTGDGGGDSVTVSGTLSPNAAGLYLRIGTLNGYGIYARGVDYILFQGGTDWILQDYSGGITQQADAWSSGSIEGPAGTYSPSGAFTGNAIVVLNSASAQIEGENLTLPNTVSSVTSATVWDAANSIYSIVKPTTNGVLMLYLVDALNVETLVGIYAPGETLPCYRRYAVPRRCVESDQAVVFCKIRHVDVVVDNDEIFPGNLNALECALMALNYRRKDNMDRYESYMNDAMRSLNADLEDFTAEQSYGVMQIDISIGMGRVPNLM